MSLTTEKKKEIKTLAEETRVKYQESKLPPYNPAQISSKMGVKVFYANFKAENVSAALFVNNEPGKEKAEIYVKATDNPLRQNFSIAHEIGHYLLHKKRTFIDEPEQFWRNESEKGSKEEQEANFFAAELLMPTEIFKSRWNETKGQPEDLSKEFAVSVAAVLFRARDLGFF